jgi:hypothetical protein
MTNTTQHSGQFYRAISLSAAAFLFCAAVLLALSISAGLFPLPFPAFAGAFFLDSYGIISFLIPLWLIAAAWMLCERSYKPLHIFLLNAALAPFLTLAAGFHCLQDFDLWTEQFGLLRVFGRGGFTLAVVFVCILEGVTAWALSLLFFVPPQAKKQGLLEDLRTEEKSSHRGAEDAAEAEEEGQTLDTTHPSSPIIPSSLPTPTNLAPATDLYPDFVWPDEPTNGRQPADTASITHDTSSCGYTLGRK